MALLLVDAVGGATKGMYSTISHTIPFMPELSRVILWGLAHQQKNTTALLREVHMFCIVQLGLQLECDTFYAFW